MQRAMHLNLLLSWWAAGLIVFFSLTAGRLDGIETQPIELPTPSDHMLLVTRPKEPDSFDAGYHLLEPAKKLDPTKKSLYEKNILFDPEKKIQPKGRNTIDPMLSIREIDPVILSQFNSERIILRH